MCIAYCCYCGSKKVTTRGGCTKCGACKYVFVVAYCRKRKAIPRERKSEYMFEERGK